MSTPHDKTDQYLDALAEHNPKHPLLSDSDSHYMDTITHIVSAKRLSSAKKRELWQKSQALSTQQQPISRFNYLGLVASLVLVIGLLGVVLYTNGTDFALARQQNEPTEIVLDIPPALFDPMPELSDAFDFEYGAFTTISIDSIPSANLLADARMQWVGINAMYVPEDEEDSLSQIIERINIAHANGFKALVHLYGTPNDYSEDYMRDFANFAGLVTRGGADAIEIWYHGNIDRSFPQAVDGFGVDAYAELLEATATIIRMSNPQTLIISGAPASTGAQDMFPEQVVNDDVFLQGLMDLGVLEHVDCVGMNFLEGTVPPLATDGDNRDDYYTRYLPTMLQRYRRIVDAEIPICITKLGYFSTEGLDDVPQFYEWASNTSRDEQQRWIAQALEWLSLQVDMRLAIILNVDVPTGQSFEDGFNLNFEVDD